MPGSGFRLDVMRPEEIDAEAPATFDPAFSRFMAKLAPSPRRSTLEGREILHRSHA
jgi:hypothetical protein